MMLVKSNNEQGTGVPQIPAWCGTHHKSFFATMMPKIMRFIEERRAFTFLSNQICDFHVTED